MIGPERTEFEPVDPGHEGATTMEPTAANPTVKPTHLRRFLTSLYATVADPRNGHLFGLLRMVAADPRWMRDER